jgi:hypothetical protein
VAKELEGSNVFIYIAVIHLQPSQFILCMFMFHIVNKGLLEVSFKTLPGRHFKGELGGVGLNLVKPIIGTVCCVHPSTFGPSMRLRKNADFM